MLRQERAAVSRTAQIQFDYLLPARPVYGDMSGQPGDLDAAHDRDQLGRPRAGQWIGLCGYRWRRHCDANGQRHPPVRLWLPLILR